MASPSNLRPKASCGCEAFQSPRPRHFSHDVAQVSIAIQHARATAWTALRSSRSIVVFLMLFQPEHDFSSWHISETADVDNEYPIVERKQTSCVLTFRCRQDLRAGRRARPACRKCH